jgi:general secretion pathway protein D
MVQLDVSQEVSQVSAPTTTSAAQSQSPTISTRRIATTVAVRDGQVIALGGLFSDQKTVDRNGIPLLSQIPYIGSLFGTHTINHTRTELIVLLKPHVLATDDDARAVTDELRAKLKTLEPFRGPGRIP